MSGQLRSDKAIGGMSDEEWKNAKPRYEHIARPEERERNAEEESINELHREKARKKLLFLRQKTIV